MSRAAAFLVVFLIRTYQALIRPFLIGACKFHPTCSEYAAEAVAIHGVRRGLRHGLRRLLRCHPFTPGGLDPVPEASERLIVPHASPRGPQVAVNSRR